MILLLDNYDSFVFNLAQYLGELGRELKVVRNDRIGVDEIARMHPDGIVISPGPGRPEDAGVSVEVIRKLGRGIPLLGVCLGHQAIGVAFGAQVRSAPAVMHGKTSEIFHDGQGLFAGVRNPFGATRYHSLVVTREGLPQCLAVSAWTRDGLIMGLRHVDFCIEGVQFHPESILTGEGKRIIANFASMTASPAGGDGRRASEEGG